MGRKDWISKERDFLLPLKIKKAVREEGISLRRNFLEFFRGADKYDAGLSKI